jgi:hypothetical protein
MSAHDRQPPRPVRRVRRAAGGSFAPRRRNNALRPQRRDACRRGVTTNPARPAGDQRRRAAAGSSALSVTPARPTQSA